MNYSLLYTSLPKYSASGLEKTHSFLICRCRLEHLFIQFNHNFPLPDHDNPLTIGQSLSSRRYCYFMGPRRMCMIQASGALCASSTTTGLCEQAYAVLVFSRGGALYFSKDALALLPYASARGNIRLIPSIHALVIRRILHECDLTRVPLAVLLNLTMLPCSDSSSTTGKSLVRRGLPNA